MRVSVYSQLSAGRSRRGAPLLAACLACLSGCVGLVTANDGEQVTIEHDGFGLVAMETVRKVAMKACIQNGKVGATHVRTINVNPSLGKGKGAQLSTFRCS
jgi:hypothetical protein